MQTAPTMILSHVDFEYIVRPECSAIPDRRQKHLFVQVSEPPARHYADSSHQHGREANWALCIMNYALI